GLAVRRRGILVAATASPLGDPYCSLAWGRRLASAAGESTAAGVLAGGEEGLTAQEAVLARWARKIAADATSATADDVRELSEAGFTDDEIFAITAYVAGRIAFSTVNNALGARPDRELIAITPDSIRDAVARLRPRQAAKN